MKTPWYRKLMGQYWDGYQWKKLPPPRNDCTHGDCIWYNCCQAGVPNCKPITYEEK